MATQSLNGTTVSETEDDVLLDLDDVVNEPKYVKFGGIKHEIQVPDVEGYLALLLLRRRMLKENGGEEDEYTNVRQAIQMIHASIPTIGVDKLNKMKIEKIMLLTNVIQQATGDITPAPAGDETSPNGESASESVLSSSSEG